MRVFVTGASGFIGSAVVAELISTGHSVLGLARSESAAAAVAAAGAEVHRGDLDDPDGLRTAAASADGVIHLAFRHDFADYGAAAQIDRRAIETLGAALAGSGRPLVVTSGMAGLAGPSGVVTEHDAAPPESPRVSEAAALPLAGRGVRVSVVRLPPTVHGEGDHGFIPRIVEAARHAGVSAYAEAGTNHWPAVHRLDAAKLFRLALESAPVEAILHAVHDEGVETRVIAEVIGRHLGVPVRSVADTALADRLGFIGMVFAMDIRASSEITRKLLGWNPTQVRLVDDLEQGHYFADARA